MKRALPFAALALGAALTVLAQEFPPPPGPDAPPDASPAARGPEGKQRREMMRLMVVSRMRDRLALSEAQTVKVMTILDSMEKQQESQRGDMEPLLERLRALVENPATTEAAFKDAVGAMKAKRADQEKQNQAREEELLSILTPRQQAQWLLLRRELMGRLRGDGPEPGRPGPGPAGEEGGPRPHRNR